MQERRKEDSRIEVLTERVDNWMGSTTEYRKALCDKVDASNRKIDALSDKISLLPCRERVEGTKGIKVQLKALWLVTGGMVIAIISEWIKAR